LVGLKKRIMKKILLAFDGINFSEGAFEFARRLNEKDKILATAAFMPQVSYANLWSYAGTAGGTVAVPSIPLIEDEEAEQIERNIERFELLCKNNDIEFRIHKDFYDFALPELKRETRFADLVILGSESFYSSVGIGEPNDYLKTALHDVECPVILVPEKFDFPRNNVLAYDGSDSSVCAIKQFAYLFPEFTKQPTLLVYSRDEYEDDIPDIEYIEELATRHFPDLTITKFHLDPKDFFADWIRTRKNAILVSGSFGRSSLSRVFKRSFVREVIKDHKLPVFITHR
jgi:hypothetical protein